MTDDTTTEAVTPRDRARKLLDDMAEALAPFAVDGGDVETHVLSEYDERKVDFGENALDLLAEIAAPPAAIAADDYPALAQALMAAIQPLIDYRDANLDIEEMDPTVTPRARYEAAAAIDIAFDAIDMALRTLENPEDE